jgi:hypothetical protein
MSLDMALGMAFQEIDADHRQSDSEHHRSLR